METAGVPDAGLTAKRSADIDANSANANDSVEPAPKRKDEGGRRHKCYVIDVSGSMEGGKLSACKKAVREEVNASPASTIYTLVTFSDEVIVHELSSRAELLAALGAIRAAGLTALFKAVGAAVEAARAALEWHGDPMSSLLMTVLTDGCDNQDPAGELQASAKAKVVELLRSAQVLLLQPGGDGALARKLGVPEATALTFSNDMHHMSVALEAARSVSEDYYAQPPSLRRAGSISFNTLQRQASFVASEGRASNPTPEISRVPTEPWRPPPALFRPLMRQDSFW